MFKYLFLILFILFSFNITVGEIINLPYTETSNTTQINIYEYNNNTYNILTLNDNEIYQITQYYKFGVLNVDEGIYYSNSSFIHNYINTTISEKYNITDALFSKKVNYDLIIYENNIDQNVIENDKLPAKPGMDSATTAPAIGSTTYSVANWAKIIPSIVPTLHRIIP